MSFKITCPYCFRSMQDDEVMFRSEKVNRGNSNILPDTIDDFDDFLTRYRGADKEEIIKKYAEWEFFAESEDPEYEAFWANYNGTTEYNPVDDLLNIKAYHRKVIDPGNPQHQRYLKKVGADYFYRDKQGMVNMIELMSGEKCNRRVCRYCHNPLPDNYGKTNVKFATVIGIVGAGKTVYLSQLLKKMKTYVAKVGLNAPDSSASVTEFKNANPIIANTPLPGSTPANKLQQPLFYELVRDLGNNKKSVETFVVYDVAGEVFQRNDPDAVRRFAPFVERADAVILLLDPLQFEVVSGAAIGKKELADPTTALETIHSIVAGDTEEKCDTPFAVCISKIDTEEVQNVLSGRLRELLLNDVIGVKDSSGINQTTFNAHEYNPILEELIDFMQNNDDNRMVLADQMRTNYSRYSYFAFTALGCEVKERKEPSGQVVQYPVGPVLPKRIEEPLLWIFHELGYIDTSEPIAYPYNKVCPECGSRKTYELPEEERTIKQGWFRKPLIVSHCCYECGHKWLVDT